MAVWGVLTEKSSPLNPKFNNRYYVDALDADEALVYGGLLWDAEQTIMGSTVTCDRVHVWLPNSTPNQFKNLFIGENGAIAASTPFKSEIVVKCFFSGGGSYPNYKNYRVHLLPSFLNGINWSGSYITTLIAFENTMSTYSWLVTKSGFALETPSVSDEYWFQQVGKQWYDRAPS